MPVLASVFTGYDLTDRPTALELMITGLEPVSLLLFAITALIYFGGLWRLWHRTHIGSGVRYVEAWMFFAGWIVLCVALVSPVHPLGSYLFWVHMVQHELLMIIAAPLLVVGRPLVACLWALPSRWRKTLGQFAALDLWATTWTVLSLPFVAWLIHALALWVWHIPTLFQATLSSEWVHTAQHASFIGTALLFWWSIIYGRQRATGYGMAVLYLFTTAAHSGALGALLTFSQQTWYASYVKTAPVWGITALEDQQLGGLIMWIPAGLIYIAAGLALFAAWLHESDRRLLSLSSSTNKRQNDSITDSRISTPGSFV